MEHEPVTLWHAIFAVACILSVFATATLTYVEIARMIGPKRRPADEDQGDAL